MKVGRSLPTEDVARRLAALKETTIEAAALQLGMLPETLASWVRQTEKRGQKVEYMSLRSLRKNDRLMALKRKTVREAAYQLGISPSSLHTWIRKEKRNGQEVDYIRAGGALSKSEIDRRVAVLKGRTLKEASAILGLNRRQLSSWIGYRKQHQLPVGDYVKRVKKPLALNRPMGSNTLACTLGHNIEKMGTDAIRWADRFRTGQRLTFNEDKAYEAFVDKIKAWWPSDKCDIIEPLYLPFKSQWREDSLDNLVSALNNVARYMLTKSVDADDPFLNPTFLDKLL